MLLLITSDTHMMFGFVQKLVELGKSEKAKAILHAGDHLEFTEFGRFPEAEQVKAATQSMQGCNLDTRLITCSGNHDVEGKNKTWLNNLMLPGVSADNSHTLLEDKGLVILITSIPYNSPTASSIAEEGKEKAEAYKAKWIVLTHEPPKDSKTAGGNGGNLISRKIINQFSPDYFVCGHRHFAPYLKNGAWNDTMRSTIVLNPGRKDTQFPNYIWLSINTDGTHSAKWKTNQLRAIR